MSRIALRRSPDNPLKPTRRYDVDAQEKQAVKRNEDMIPQLVMSMKDKQHLHSSNHQTIFASLSSCSSMSCIINVNATFGVFEVSGGRVP